MTLYSLHKLDITTNPIQKAVDTTILADIKLGESQTFDIHSRVPYFCLDE